MNIIYLKWTSTQKNSSVRLLYLPQTSSQSIGVHSHRWTNVNTMSGIKLFQPLMLSLTLLTFFTFVIFYDISAHWTQDPRPDRNAKSLLRGVFQRATLRTILEPFPVSGVLRLTHITPTPAHHNPVSKPHAPPPPHIHTHTFSHWEIWEAEAEEALKLTEHSH